MFHVVSSSQVIVNKVKQSHNWPSVAQRFQEALAPRFHDMVVVRLSASPTGRLYPQEIFLLLISTRGRVDPRAMLRSEGNMSLKNPVTPPGIDPGTVRLVAQRLNHYAPVIINAIFNFKWIT